MPGVVRVEAVVFDMDGVLVDTEHLWDEVREELTEEWGGRYTPEAQEAMMGMSSPEWSRYLHETVGLREPPEVINAEVVRRMLARYEAELPVVPGAVEAVRRLAADGLRLAVASSSNRELIDAVLRRLELDSLFAVTVSSEEVARGKPAPDVYLEAARRLGVDAGALRRRRGLGERDPRSARGRHARDRVPEPALPARGRRARARGRRARLARRTPPRGADTMTVRTRSTCPSCTGELLRQILHWPSIPVNASLFPSTREESLAIPQGSFRLAACETCGLLFNADHDEELVEYSPACIETQTISARHRAFTDQLAHDWIERHGLRDASVVEVGCGPDASFLSLLRAKGNVTGTGIDPAAEVQFDGDGATLLAARFTEHHSQIPGRA